MSVGRAPFNVKITKQPTSILTMSGEKSDFISQKNVHNGSIWFSRSKDGRHEALDSRAESRYKLIDPPPLVESRIPPMILKARGTKPRSCFSLCLSKLILIRHRLERRYFLLFYHKIFSEIAQLLRIAPNN